MCRLQRECSRTNDIVCAGVYLTFSFSCVLLLFLCVTHNQGKPTSTILEPLHTFFDTMYARQSHHKSARSVTLLDPVYRCGLLEIPLEKTLPTKGRDEWLDGRLTKDLSLCCLFQKGRCHAQERCYQVHVDRDFIAALREQQSRIVSCCRSCNDTGSLSHQAMTFFSSNIPCGTSVHVVYANAAIRILDSNSIAYSAGLVQQFEEHGATVENGVLVIPARRICRLHLRGCCKYGKDCKNVHACSKLGEKFLDAPNPTVVAPAVVPKFAVRLPESTRCVAPVAVAAQSPPMTSFAPVAVAPVPHSNPLGVSLSLKSGDALEYGECSLRMLKKSFLFDAAMALEDSALTASLSEDASIISNDGCNAVHLNRNEAPVTCSPGQKRHHAVHLDYLHPCSKPRSSMQACRVDQWETIALFA